MSDIGLKGVGGFVVIGATTLGAALVTLIAAIAAFAVSSHRALPVGQTVARFISGPISATVAAAAAFAWAWDGPSDAVDRFAPLLVLGSIVVGILAGILVHRSSRGQPRPAPPR